MKIRRQARAIALQALYEMDSVGHRLDSALDNRVADEHLPEEGAAFARQLAGGTFEHRARLDAIISRYAPEYPVDQLAIVDRNILRLALYELLYVEDVPSKVAINEAVELAKTFGSDTAPRFVNGVLGTFMLDNPVAELRQREQKVDRATRRQVNKSE